VNQQLSVIICCCRVASTKLLWKRHRSSHQCKLVWAGRTWNPAAAGGGRERLTRTGNGCRRTTAAGGGRRRTRNAGGGRRRAPANCSGRRRRQRPAAAGVGRRRPARPPAGGADRRRQAPGDDGRWRLLTASCSRGRWMAGAAGRRGQRRRAITGGAGRAAATGRNWRRATAADGGRTASADGRKAVRTFAGGGGQQQGRLLLLVTAAQPDTLRGRLQRVWESAAVHCLRRMRARQACSERIRV